MNIFEKQIEFSKELNEKRESVKRFFQGLNFDALQHSYTHKEQKLSSASSVIKNYVKPFDADKIAGFVARKENISKEEVLQKWEDKKNEACDKGNRVHDFGENHGNYLSGKGSHVRD